MVDPKAARPSLVPHYATTGQAGYAAAQTGGTTLTLTWFIPFSRSLGELCGALQHTL